MKTMMSVMVVGTGLVAGGSVAAQDVAVSAVDFGRLVKGETEVGVGYGYSSTSGYSSTAAAVGAKYAFTDKVSVVGKAAIDMREDWERESDYSVGGGLVYKF